VAGALTFALVAADGCSDDGSSGTAGVETTSPDGGAGGGALGGSGGSGGAAVGGGGAAPQPQQYVPCENGDCWSAPDLVAYCGDSTVDEDYSSGLYNLHEYALDAPADVPLELTLEATAGTWSPALIIRDDQGTTLHDGEVAASNASVTGEPLESGRDSTTARVRLTAHADMPLRVFATSWGVIDSGFTDPMPTDATYQLQVTGDCQAGPIDLITPPNFDPNDTDSGGYYLLPESEPAGLYTKKHDDCSRGTQLLVEVLYTVAWHWHQQRPALSPIAFRDLNEAWCSSVDHATHDDGTHADVVITCATDVSCSDKEPFLELTRLIIDTGQACGIISDQPSAVLDQVNAYFTANHGYTPWWSTFARPGDPGVHTAHMHVRVKRPDGTCAPY
jgi:hypothetical protein